MGVPGRVLLGLEQRIKVPEAARHHGNPHQRSMWQKQNGAGTMSIVNMPFPNL